MFPYWWVLFTAIILVLLIFFFLFLFSTEKKNQKLIKFSGCLDMQIVLILGTKLEVIVAKMALQLKNQSNVIVGAPLVKPNDDLFWFRHPSFVLNLLHFTLFVVCYVVNIKLLNWTKRIVLLTWAGF